MADITLQGARELEAKLSALGNTIDKKIARQALRAGAKIIQEAVKSAAPRKTGLLARAVKVRAIKKRTPGKVGVRVAIPAGTSPTFYSAFIVYGRHIGKRTAEQQRAARKHLKFVDTRKTVPPNPFAQDAFNRTKDQALAEITAQLRAGIAAAAKTK